MKKILIAFIRIYQKTLSPWLGHHCRFYPSCSHYAVEAIESRGVLAGLVLSAKRLLKCQPFHAGGVDFLEQRIASR